MIKTDPLKSAIYFSNDSHSGAHPVTMRALTPSPSVPCQRRASATPAAETHSPRSSASVSPAAETHSPRPAAPVSPAAETHSPRSAAGASAPAAVPTPAADISPATVTPPQDPLTENVALREEVTRLRAELQVILDHSIESDQRLLEFTDDVFLPPPSMSTSIRSASTPNSHLKQAQLKDLHCCENMKSTSEQLDSALAKVIILEQEIKNLRRPCAPCAILKDESKKMIDSIRCLESENKWLKQQVEFKSRCEANVIPAHSLELHNGFSILSGKDNNCEESVGTDNSFTIIKKKRNKRRNGQGMQSKLQGKKNKISTPSIDFQKIPFQHVTVIGDSHVRGMAALMRDRLKAGPAVSGICKPGAGLLDVRPTSTPPRDHCYVVMAGTNDVDAGREGVIFKHLEDVLQTCTESSSVLLLPLTSRHDLDPRSPVHNTIRLINQYMAELCRRHRGVEMLDIGSVRRHHYTSHGLHLNIGGKRHLASLVVERLAHMTPPPPRPRLPLRRPAAAPPPDSAPSPIMPRTLPHENYAMAVKQTIHPDSFTNKLSSNSKPFLARLLASPGLNLI